MLRPKSVVPVILCGGAGSRLWPVSRECRPKPFIRLADGQSLLQKVFRRGANLPDVAEILTVTNRELLFATRDEYAAVNPRGLPTPFLLEPFGRNTAPAVAAASLSIAERHGGDALVLVLPADHLIADEAAFAAAVARAEDLAGGGAIVTFGIEPERAETGYGYIEAEGQRVLRFVEKPDAETARAYVESGRFLWNSGMFCFAAGAMLAELARHCPAVIEAVRPALDQARPHGETGGARLELEEASFARAPDISIDYAVMEKSDRVAVVPCRIGWNDIGSWTALGDLVEADAQGNRVLGEALLHDVSNCFIQGDGRMIGAIGLDNLIVVDTPDALLVANRDRAQDVRAIYAELKRRGHDTHKTHRTVARPWGTYTILGEGPGFKIKRIEVKPGASLSLQMHYHRSEHWIVVSGMARVVNGTRDMLVNTNESTFIPAGHRHRLSNPGLIDLVMIEVQNGVYLGEDDIVRFEDKYGRLSEPEPTPAAAAPAGSETEKPAP